MLVLVRTAACSQAMWLVLDVLPEEIVERSEHVDLELGEGVVACSASVLEAQADCLHGLDETPLLEPVRPDQLHELRSCEVIRRRDAGVTRLRGLVPVKRDRVGRGADRCPERNVRRGRQLRPSQLHLRLVVRWVGARHAGAQTGARPRALRLAAVCRFCAESSILRSRMSDGVTSTHSSSRMYSSAWSSESHRGGISRTVESAEGARVFVSFFSFVALTSRSSTRAFSPTIIPS